MKDRNTPTFVAIDPLALVLPGDIYADWNKPRPGAEDIKARVRQVVQGLSPQQREQVTEHVRLVQEFARAVETELGNKVAGKTVVQTR